MQTVNMRVFQIVILLMFILPFSMTGQTEQVVVENQEDTTSVIVIKKSILEILAEDGYGLVRISQESDIDTLLEKYVELASTRNLRGYRIRIFNDNAQTAREASLEMENLFREKYPDVAVYRTFVGINFRVTVGDFRTKSDAERFRREMVKDFPATPFIIGENINFPPL